MTIVLGIDTGGTYTDAVLVNYENGKILSSAKSLTTHQDLSAGIHSAITSVMTIRHQDISPQKICLVGLSTTLATNAITEGHGVPVCLLLIGYDRDLIHQYRFQHALGTRNVAYLQGGHDQQGIARQPLDEDAIRSTVLKWRKKVSAFGVSGYFGAFNPDRRLVIHQHDAAGTAIGQTEFGLEIGDGGRVDAETGRDLIEINRDKARIVQGDGGHTRLRRG